MISGLGPVVFQGIRSYRPVQPVVAAIAPARDAPSSQVSIGERTARPGDGLYNRAGTVASSVQRRETFDLTIQTAEGDTATLRLSQSMELRSDAGQSSYRSLDMQMQVEGDLNTQEAQAINTLMQQVSQVAEQFFGGDIANATRGAGALTLQGDALNAFSMNLHYQETRRATAAYQSVAQLSGPDVAAPPSLAKPLESPALTTADLLTQMKNLFADLARSAKDLMEPREQPSAKA